MVETMTLPVGCVRRSARRLTCALLVCAYAATGLCWTPVAHSATASGLVVIPRPASGPDLSYFKLSLKPAQAGTAGAIELRNPSRRRLRAVLTAVDGKTINTLGSTYGRPGSRAHGSTPWLRFGRRTITLSPGRSAAVPVSVLVPRTARPGDYLSGISIEALDQRPRRARGGGVSIASVVRYAIGVEVSLPGPRHPLIQFTGAKLQRQPAGLSFQLLARNSGNVVLQGVRGAVRIRRAGHTVLSRQIPAGTFVTGTAIAYPVPAFGETPRQGTRYRISAWMRYPGGIARMDTTVSFGHRQAVVQQQYRRPSTAQGTAWWKIAGIAGLILYGLGTTVLLLGRHRRARRNAEQAMRVAHSRERPESERESQPV
jgi:hypothetical protein